MDNRREAGLSEQMTTLANEASSDETKAPLRFASLLRPIRPQKTIAINLIDW